MAEARHLAAYGLRPPAQELPAIRELLAGQAARERVAQGESDTELMKLCYVLLFNAGELPM
jgi:hypothetical protein